MLTNKAAFGVAALMALFGCTQLVPNPHYVLEKSYQKRTIWYYPRESFDLVETGLASVAASGPARLTADGEVFDQAALAVAHKTLQLPAVARLTNLENGRQVVVRVNDRGSGDPHRVVEVTERTAELLQMPRQGVARVRLTVLPVESHAVIDGMAGTFSLAITAAPRDGVVQVAELPPPPGVRQGTGRAASASAGHVAAADPLVSAKPVQLPETVTRTAPSPGGLYVHLDTFEDFQYASVQQARMSFAGARIVSSVQGRTHLFQVVIGPLPDVAHADHVLDQAFAIGIPDARIVVE